MVKSKYRGHSIEYVFEKVWVYSDTKEPVKFSIKRDCGRCRLPVTKEEHDGCIGTLKHVMNACCGHGETREAYIQFTDDFRISGIFALIVARLLKCI